MSQFIGSTSVRMAYGSLINIVTPLLNEKENILEKLQISMSIF